MKNCPKCNTLKELNEFFNDKHTKDKLSVYCKLCQRLKQQLRNKAKYEKLGIKQKRSAIESQQDIASGVKYCPKCKFKKPLIEFLKNKASKNGIDFHCRKCKRELVKQYGLTKEERRLEYLKRKDEIKAKRLKYKFGISVEEYQRLLAEQDGKCLICSKTEAENKKSLAIDHCHFSGKIRGLLCGNCNAALGFVKESIEITQGLMRYIKEKCYGIHEHR